MTADLKPCPFCGGAAYFERTGTRRQSCIVACFDCGACYESRDEDERSGQSWNRRVPAGVAPAPQCPKGCGLMGTFFDGWRCNHCGETARGVATDGGDDADH